MCGIGAFQLKEGDGNPRLLAQTLLRGLSIRGRDAAGVAWHTDDAEPQTYIHKFNCDGWDLAKALDKNVGRTAIVHTRYATLGSPKVMSNNHPIDVEGVVGVHNGHVNNHEQLFQKVRGYKRKGTVDSEAIFAYLRYGTSGRSLTDKLSDINGAAAIMWLQTNSPKRYLHVARITQSPLCYGKTKAGSVILASTKDILVKAVEQADLEIGDVVTLDEGVYLRFEDGDISRMLDIPLPAPQAPLFKWPTHTITSSVPKNLGAGVGGEFRDGRWHTALELMMAQWEQDERDMRDDS